MILNRKISRFLAIFLSICLVASLVPLNSSAESTATIPYWDYYTLQSYSTDHSESTARGNWYNISDITNFSDFSLKDCNFDDEKIRALKLSVEAGDSADMASLMLKNLANTSLIDEAAGMRFHVSNPSDTTVAIGITYCDTNAIYSCHKTGLYYLETKGEFYQATPAAQWDSFYEGGANDVGIVEIPSGFSGYIYIPFSSTTRASEKSSFSRVRLFVGAKAGLAQTLYLESIDYYSTSVEFSDAAITDYGFDAFSTLPVSSADTVSYISLGFSNENCDGFSGKSLKTDFNVNPSDSSGYVGWRINGWWGKFYHSTAHGMRFWTKNPQNRDVEVRLQFGDSYKPCKINSPYYLEQGEKIVRCTTTTASNESIGCITIPANFEGYVYLPYQIASSSVTSGHLILSPKVSEDLTLYFDSFSSFDKQELGEVVWYNINKKLTVGPGLSPTLSYTKTMLDSASGQVLWIENTNSFEIPLSISNTTGSAYLIYDDGDIEVNRISNNNLVYIPEKFNGKLYLPFADSQTSLYDISASKASRLGTIAVAAIGVYNTEVYPLGDANFDGDFNIFDLIRCKKHLLGLSTEISDNADINKDFRYNSFDLVLLTNGLLRGIISAKNSYVPSDVIEPLDVSVYTPLYNDSELIIAEENVCDYGADATGNADSTTAFKNAILNAEQNGGGTVYIPEGRYLITETITIPESVTLCGQWKSPEESPVGDCGSIILAKSDNFLTSAVFELSKSTGIIGLTVIYPEQNVSSPIEYDYAVRVIGARCYTLKNFTVIGAYNGIELGTLTQSCEVYFLKNVYISALNIGISNDRTSDTGRMETVKCSPQYWCDNTISSFTNAEKENIKEYVRSHAYGMTFYLNDWSIFYDIDISHMKTGIYFGVTNTETDRGFNGKFYNVSIYNCDTGIYIDKTKTGGADFTNLTIKTDVSATAGIDTGSLYYGTCMFYNTEITGNFAYPVRNNGYTQVSNPGTLEFLSGTIGGYSGNSYGVTVNGGSVTLQDVYFSNSSKHVKTVDKITSLVALGCRYNGSRDFDIPSLWRILKDWKIDDNAVVSYVPDTISLESDEYKPISDTVVCVTDYGADTSLADNTEAFTKAFDALKDVGGTVYVPAGNWRFESELVIPSGIELRGSNAAQHIQNSEHRSGTVLWCFSESGEDGDAFITLEENAGARGFAVFYDEQIKTTTPYPYSIKANGKNCWVVNITLTNSYNGLDFASCDTSGYYISGVNGCPANIGINIGSSSQNGTIKNCQFNPNFSYILTGDMANRTDRLYNATAYKFGDISGCTAYGLFAYGYKNGIHFVSNETGGAKDITLLNCGVDGSETSVRVEEAYSVNIINGQFVAMESENDKHCLLTEENFTGTLKLYNSNLWGPTNYVIKLCNGNNEFHLVNLCVGAVDYALYITGGSSLFNAVCFHNLSIVVSGSNTTAEFLGCFTRAYQFIIEPEIQDNATVTVKNSHWA